MQENNFGLKKIFFLSLPLIFSNLVNASSSIISMYFLAKLSTDALAASAIISSTYGLIVMMVISILIAVSIMVGKMIGANETNEIGAILFSGCIISLILGIPLTVLMFNFGKIFALLGQPYTISLLAGAYFKGVAFGFIPSLISAAFMQFLMGSGRTKLILYLTMFGVLINAILSDVLIFGAKSISALGMFGGGLASALTAWILLGLTLLLFIFKREISSYKFFHKKNIQFKYIPILLRIGIPISIQYMAEILSFVVITYMMGLIGEKALSAQQIVLQCGMISIMIVMAISQSSSILVSQALGQGNFKSIVKIGKSAQLLGMIFMLGIACIYWFLPVSLISIYLNINDSTTTSIVTLTKSFLIISAFTQIFDGVRNISAGLLRGLGDTKSSMWTGIVSCWIIGIPMAVILGFYLNDGALGIRFGVMLGILIGSILLLLRFYRTQIKFGENFI